MLSYGWLVAGKGVYLPESDSDDSRQKPYNSQIRTELYGSNSGRQNYTASRVRSDVTNPRDIFSNRSRTRRVPAAIIQSGLRCTVSLDDSGVCDVLRIRVRVRQTQERVLSRRLYVYVRNIRTLLIQEEATVNRNAGWKGAQVDCNQRTPKSECSRSNCSH